MKNILVNREVLAVVIEHLSFNRTDKISFFFCVRHAIKPNQISPLLSRVILLTAGAVTETRLNWTRVNESGPPCRQRGGIWAPRLMAVHLLPALFICLCCLFAGGGRRGISGGGPEGSVIASSGYKWQTQVVLCA
jgi:hypothetical protein